MRKMMDNLANLWASIEFFFDSHGLFLAQFLVVAYHVVFTLVGVAALAVMVKFLVTL